MNSSKRLWSFLNKPKDCGVNSNRYVFLSFCGEDTRYSFTGFLYHALCREGFKIFMDDEGLEGGNQISQTLLKAIEKSRLSIVVLSENYGVQEDK
ncbi:putative TIR domain-containing protein [Medicago truncatula]|uniref:Putative TIR domain-containing protein n=1 Tax=Medicago truncatula TaxID=3880 RepID=A0A396HYW3_MEDTR|nr:putative TIR domain-containing protein [Medicago truncatula]